MTPTFISQFRQGETAIHKRTNQRGKLLGAWGSITGCTACHKPATPVEYRSACCNARIETVPAPGVWNVLFESEDEITPIHEYHLLKARRARA